MKHILSGIMVVVWLLVLSVSPLLAGDALSDFFSRTEIVYSHVAIINGWKTDVAVINPTDQRVSGSFYFYDMQGNQLGSAFPVTLNPHGRYETEVGATFGSRGAIEYMVFRAPLYGMKGYSKFYFEGIRASIMASSPQTTGLFAKIDHQGWTGIAFVNAGSEDNSVVLTAYNDQGGVEALTVMTLHAGEKVVKTAKEIFAPQSVAGASYVAFTADHGVVGFFLNGTLDNIKLDGSRAL